MREEHLEVRQSPRRVDNPILANVHVVVFLAALALVALQAAGVILAPAYGPRELKDVEDAHQAFETAANTAQFPVEARTRETSDELAAVAAALKPKPPPASAPVRGLTYPPTYLETLKPGASNEIKFAPPTGVRASAEVGGVDLVWADPAGNNVAIGEFEILRSEDGGDLVPTAKVKGDQFAWRDASAVPGKDYVYRVRAVTREGAVGSAGVARSDLSDAAQVRAIADFKIELVDFLPDAARFRVSRWRDGDWRTRIFEVAQGRPIGGRDEALGVDYSTGRRLASFVVEERTEPASREEVVFGPDAKVVVEDGAPRKVKVVRDVIVRKAVATVDGGALPPETLTLEKRPQ
ncbi:MAG TPA: fibronectin type III domain-containing protein [Planctomycetota bacterium]|nr:fibronectin type III domain-containing protein [Planctomycetota bacterium]